MPSPIHLHTVADLLARDHSLGLYCLRCDRWAEAPLAQLAARGLADRPIERLNFRCVICGRSAKCQLRPPAISIAGPAGWMEQQAPAATTPRADLDPERPPPKATPSPSTRRRRRRSWAARRGTIPWNIEEDYF